MGNRTCSADGCERKHQAKGWCDKHYRRVVAYGDPEPFAPPLRVTVDAADGGGYKQQLPCGRWFHFDAEDADTVDAYRWHVVNGYVQTETGSRKHGTRKTLRLHRMILGVSGADCVDHINRDPFDNRRANLRIADKSKNGMNRTAQANNKSGFKGVCKRYRRGKWTGKWQANITVRGRTYNLGTTFPTPELAHAAYVKAAIELHEDFACA